MSDARWFEVEEDVAASYGQFDPARAHTAIAAAELIAQGLRPAIEAFRRQVDP